jgi:hypothetical protein
VGTGDSIIDSIICVAVIVELVVLLGQADHALLQRRHRGIADLDRQIATGDHDAVAGLQDLLEIADGLEALDLGDHQRMPPAARTSSRAMYMSGAFLGNDTATKSASKRHRGLDVVHVLGGQRRRGQPAALAVDALAVRQHPAQRHRALDGAVRPLSVDAASSSGRR